MPPKPHLAPIPVRGRIGRAQPAGLPIVNMGFNELPYPPGPAVRAALSKACDAVQSYGSPACDALRTALGTQHGLDPDRLVCGNGSEELLDVIARCFARPGDRILISEFGYIQFVLTANRVGADLIKAPEVDHVTDIEALLACVDDRTRLVFLANPNNPTGTMLPPKALAQLIARLRDDVVLVLDLAYGEFAGDAYCAAVHALAEGTQNVVVTRTFSKAFGLAGARVGWCHAPAWMVPVLYAARGMGSVNALAQAGAIAALDDLPTARRHVAEIVAERDRVAAGLARMGLRTLPSHANFLLARIEGGDAAQVEALVEHLFDDAGIIVNRTREAGLEDWFRFSLHLPANNDALLASIARFVG